MHDVKVTKNTQMKWLVEAENTSADGRMDLFFFFAKNAMELSKAMPKRINKLPLQNKMGK